MRFILAIRTSVGQDPESEKGKNDFVRFAIVVLWTDIVRGIPCDTTLMLVTRCDEVYWVKKGTERLTCGRGSPSTKYMVGNIPARRDWRHTKQGITPDMQGSIRIKKHVIRHSQ